MLNWSAEAVLTPKRRRGFEHLDDPAVSDTLRDRSMRDVRISNLLLGGRRAVVAEVLRALPMLGASPTLLDVGTGLGDIPAMVAASARAQRTEVRTCGFDGSPALASSARRALDDATCGDARALPFATASFDVVTCSQLLHHFTDDEVASVLKELHRVARRVVIVSDLRRSWIAAAGFWTVTWPLGFHAVTRHDGTTSVLRGFTDAELGEHVRKAVGSAPSIRRHPGFRLTATWVPAQ